MVNRQIRSKAGAAKKRAPAFWTGALEEEKE
jgi:hypothetical protein